MSKIVNLNQARKLRSRLTKQSKAVENTEKFGRTKAQKNLEKARAQKARRDLDGARRED